MKPGRNTGNFIFKLILSILILFLNAELSKSKPVSEHINYRIDWKELPLLPPNPGKSHQPGVSAPFAGISNDALIVAGGCNFPDNPVYTGGIKEYYSDVFVLEKTSEGFSWYDGFNLPHTVAYGASVSTEFGLVCIGGSNSNGDHKVVLLLSWDPEAMKVNVQSWPELPYGMSQMVAVKVGNLIYVAAGQVEGQPANRFLSLDLSLVGKDEFGWKELPDFPGPPRLQPVGVAQNSAEEQRFFLISGSSYSENKAEPDIMTDGLQYNPRTGEWTKVSETDLGNGQKYSLHGAGGIPVGAHHILFIGGVNHDIFRNAWKRERLINNANENGDIKEYESLSKEKYNYLTQEPKWYKFNKEIIVYHTITDSWSAPDIYPYPGPAGAPLVKWNNNWVVVNGELKPGVRSNRLFLGTLVSMPEFGVLNWILLISYLAGMLYLGFFFMKRESSTEDFFKGGGRVPWWAAGMSIFATMLSAITFMAIPAKTFATDWKYFPMAIAIFILAFPVVKYYLPFFRRLKVTTAYEYLEVRFNALTRVLGSVLFIVFMVARTALVLFLPSLALTTVTGIDIYFCIILMGLVTIIYCTMGGVEAVIWGDVIQGFVLLGGALLAVVFLINGIDGGWPKLIEISTSYDKLRIFDFAFDFTQATFWIVMLGGLANNLISYTSDQAVIQRYLTTKDEKSAGKGILLNGVLSIVVSVVFYFIGTALFAFYKTNPGELNISMENPDSIFPYFIMTRLPIGIVGLLIAAIFAATMSTVSSSINSLSTAFTTDIYQKLVSGMSDKHYLRIARVSGIILGGLGVVFALLMVMWNILSLFDFFNYILGLLASGLGGLFIMGIFIPRIRGKSALIGFVGGFPSVLIMSLVTNIHFLIYGFTGILSTVIIGYIASMIITDDEKPLAGLTIDSLKSEK
ncbi:cyclically-permuted mutarotase family protein [Bacteroidota bacterium]